MTEYVYFIDAGEGTIKIGYSEDLATRFGVHKKAYGKATKFLFAVPGGADKERDFHACLARYRVPHERFGARGAPELFLIPKQLLEAMRAEMGKAQGFIDVLPDPVRKVAVSIDQDTDHILWKIRLWTGVSKAKVIRDAVKLYVTNLEHKEIKAA